MNLHEYQGKEILSTFGVKIQKGIVVNTPQEAVAAAKKLTEETGTDWHVLKAQVYADICTDIIYPIYFSTII